jgi:hypothetical protein
VQGDYSETTPPTNKGSRWKKKLNPTRRAASERAQGTKIASTPMCVPLRTKDKGPAIVRMSFVKIQIALMALIAIMVLSGNLKIQTKATGLVFAVKVG